MYFVEAQGRTVQVGIHLRLELVHHVLHGDRLGDGGRISWAVQGPLGVDVAMLPLQVAVRVGHRHAYDELLSQDIARQWIGRKQPLHQMEDRERARALYP